ncbi:MAG: chemotaxis protein CheX [Treponema sp.]|nr:chemotaxis protein CheX [Treponema sp.]
MECYTQPFIEVGQYVFREFMGTQIVAASPYFSDKDTLKAWDISSLIGFSGQAQGIVALSMNRNLAIQLTDILTGTPHTTIDQDTRDALGEIINIIAGNAKQRLEKTLKLIISLPRIIVGEEHTLQWLAEMSHLLCIPFTIFEHEVFILSIALKRVTDP